MGNINEAFPSKHLKASDLQGSNVTVTMDRVEFDLVGEEREKKPILYFQGKEKGLVLNKTNARKIIEITGSALTEEWKGHRITLYPSETQLRGDIVDCIRVRQPNNQPAAMPRMTKSVPPPPPPPKITDHEFDDDGPVSGDDIPF